MPIKHNNRFQQTVLRAAEPEAAEYALSKKANIVLINAGLTVAFAVLMVFHYFSRLLRRTSPEKGFYPDFTDTSFQADNVPGGVL